MPRNLDLLLLNEGTNVGMVVLLGIDGTGRALLRASLKIDKSVALLAEIVNSPFDLAANLRSMTSINDVALGTAMMAALTTADTRARAGGRRGRSAGAASSRRNLAVTTAAGAGCRSRRV